MATTKFCCEPWKKHTYIFFAYLGICGVVLFLVEKSRYKLNKRKGVYKQINLNDSDLSDDDDDEQQQIQS